jgi:acetyl-CoA carboxylase biotin carboxyl carrier protein
MGDTTVNDASVNGSGVIDKANGTADGMVPDAVADLVTLLTDRALALSAQAARAPSSVRISAGSVHVEICWSASPPPASPAGAGQSAAPQSAAPVPHSDLDLQPAATSGPSAGTFPLCASTVGTFYRSPEPGAAPFVTEGDRIHPGQQVAIIEAMKLMIPVEAERAGEVVEFLVDDRAPVEYGQPLMLVREAGP